MSDLDPGAACAAHAPVHATTLAAAGGGTTGEAGAPVVHADMTLDHDGLAGMEHFLAVIAHELRSPLNGIQSWAHVLASHSGDNSALAQRALDGIGNGVRQQARVLEDLMDAMTVLRNNLVLEPRRLVLREVLESVLEPWRAVAETRRVELRIALGLDNASFSGDPRRAPQMISHLLSNALRYTPAGGWVEVTAWVEGAVGDAAAGQPPPRALIRVQDSGRGIAHARLLRVFEPFCPPEERLEARLESGVGLGLAMVRKLVAMHGGTVLASSGGPRRGATFVMGLPLLAELVQQPGASAPTARAAVTTAMSHAGPEAVSH